MPVTSRWRLFGARVGIALFGVLAMTTFGVAYGVTIAQNYVDSIRRADVDMTPSARGEPANFLIVGSDTRAFVDTTEEVDHFGDPSQQTGQRSDTMMVLHIDPDADNSYLVSFPRDLWVDIPGEGEHKLNAAYALGGPNLAVQTIESNFDIEIHHYLEVNFATFREIVGAIGSVHLFFPTRARDTVTGLDVDAPGCVALGPEQALAYVRSRHYEYFEDGDWDEDPTADLGRIRRQQYFVRSLMREAIDQGARDLGTARQLMDRTAPKLTMDPELDLHDLYNLYTAVRTSDASGVEMVTIPSDLARSDDGQSILLVRQDEARPILARLRPPVERRKSRIEIPDLDPRTVSLEVWNGSGIDGAAGVALGKLAAANFQTVGRANADRDDYETTEVRYRPGAREQAQLVAAYLVAGGDLIETSDSGGTDVIVVLGRDFEGVRRPRGNSDAPDVDVEPVDSTTVPPPPNPGTTPGVEAPEGRTGAALVGCG